MMMPKSSFSQTQDILSDEAPIIARFLHSNARHRGIAVPIGSGKRSALCIDWPRRACAQTPFKGVRRLNFPATHYRPTTSGPPAGSPILSIFLAFTHSFSLLSIHHRTARNTFSLPATEIPVTTGIRWGV